MADAPVRTILHVDMDAFFASVEELDHPEWRGLPVIVGADPQGGAGRGVVAAASYAARRFGVRSALPIATAWRLCPQGIYVRPRGSRYGEVSRQVFAIFRDFTDRVEPLSVDEGFLDVTGSARLFGDGEKIARAIKARIKEELGLIASVGVASNKFVAKVASDLKKPDALVVVPPGGEAAFLRDLPIGRLWGVGKVTEEFLRSRGFETIGDVARLNDSAARALLGENGVHLAQLARGEDARPVSVGEEAKSIGAEVTYDEDTGELERVRSTLLALSDRVAGELRRDGFETAGVTLKFRDERFKTVTRALTLPRPSDLTDDLYHAALSLLEGLGWRGGSPRVRLVGVTAHRLLPKGSARQGDLFASGGDEKKKKAEAAVDEIRAKFGKVAIGRAAAKKKG